MEKLQACVSRLLTWLRRLPGWFQVHLSRLTRVIPKMEKITNATVLRIPSGALLFRRYPIRSPITSATKSPSEQASHTTTAELSPSLAPNVIAVSCVLSPSSATKNVQNTDSGANLILRSLTFSSSSSSPFSVVAAKNRNAAPAIRRISQVGTTVLIIPPASTASPLSTRIATPVPSKISFSLNLEVIATSISCVLSPISAINWVKRTFINNSIFLLLCIFIRSGAIKKDPRILYLCNRNKIYMSLIL